MSDTVLMTTTAAAKVPAAKLYDYQTGEYIRPATLVELTASMVAAESDGGAGVIHTIRVNGRSCYVL